MTRIGGGERDAASLAGQAASRGGRELGDDELSSRGRSDDHHASLSSGPKRFDHSEPDFSERHSQFQETMRRAMTSGRHDAADENDDQATKLLATAGSLSSAPFIAAAGVLPASDAQPLAPTTAERVDALAARIESAFRAELRGQAAVSVQIDLAGTFPGVDALTVSMSPAVIEVVLTRSAEDLPADYAASAQALADRLQSRFAKRMVRVVERDSPVREAGSRGMDDISRLLARPDRAS